MTMNTDQARVVDPVLTEVARGYSHPDRVGHVLFPRVEVSARGGRILQFGKESFRKINIRRAPGAQTQRVSFGYEGDPFVLVQDSLDVPVPREHMQDALKVPGIDLGKRAVNLGMQTATLNLEIQQSEIASDPNNYSADQKLVLAGTDKWSNLDSDPEATVRDAKETVRKACGVEPNRMVIPNQGFNALKFHPKIVERFKYTSAESITAKMLANLFDLEELAVGKGVYMDQNAAEDAPFEDIWGNNAILAYAPQDPKGFEEPSFGYTYALTNHPFVEKPIWDNGVKSWVYGVTYERQPVLAGASAGFLIQNII
ncbi:major capsid protein [Ruegeria arenilitoris]|uniref:major capsid protein n=1 Tax=Ruegeria arenilitoris TaxID=1173585 RepID=UPI00147B6203|nr:major capsid protein [Ruegeria arenilitoris]